MRTRQLQMQYKYTVDMDIKKNELKLYGLTQSIDHNIVYC